MIFNDIDPVSIITALTALFAVVISPFVQLYITKKQIKSTHELSLFEIKSKFVSEKSYLRIDHLSLISKDLIFNLTYLYSLVSRFVKIKQSVIPDFDDIGQVLYELNLITIELQKQQTEFYITYAQVNLKELTELLNLFHEINSRTTDILKMEIDIISTNIESELYELNSSMSKSKEMVLQIINEEWNRAASFDLLSSTQIQDNSNSKKNKKMPK